MIQNRLCDSMNEMFGGNNMQIITDYSENLRISWTDLKDTGSGLTAFGRWCLPGRRRKQWR